MDHLAGFAHPVDAARRRIIVLFAPNATVPPNLPMLYAGGLAAARRENYTMVRALAVDALVRDDGQRIPLIARANPWQPFNEFPLLAQVLALQASGEVVDDSTVQALQNRSRGPSTHPRVGRTPRTAASKAPSAGAR
jgi:hypothetical protein